MMTPRKPANKKLKVGRKAWKATPAILKTIEKESEKGLAEYQICYLLGICQETWFKYKRTNPELAEALKKGRAKGIKAVTNTLFERAKNGESDISIIFYLKNRDPKAWAGNFDKSQYAPVNFDLDTSKSPTEQCKQIMDAASSGKISPDIANQFITNITNMIKVQEVTDLESRLADIEKAQDDAQT